MTETTCKAVANVNNNNAAIAPQTTTTTNNTILTRKRSRSEFENVPPMTTDATPMTTTTNNYDSNINNHNISNSINSGLKSSKLTRRRHKNPVPDSNSNHNHNQPSSHVHEEKSSAGTGDNEQRSHTLNTNDNTNDNDESMPSYMNAFLCQCKNGMLLRFTKTLINIKERHGQIFYNKETHGDDDLISRWYKWMHVVMTFVKMCSKR